MSISINFRLRLSKSKISKKGSKISKIITNEVATIRCIVVVNSGNEIPFSTKMYVLPSDWVQDVQRVKLSYEKAKVINKRLDTIERDLEELFEELTRYGDSISGSELVKAFIAPEKAIPNVLQVWDMYLEQVKNRIGEGKEQITLGTYVKYEKARNYFENFITHRFKRKNVNLNEIGANQAKEFREFLKTQFTKYKTALSDDYCTRTVYYTTNMLDFAKEKGFIKNNQFENIQWKRENRAIRVFLKEKDIDKLYKCEELTIVEIQITDVFVFCCYTGLSFADYHGFEYKEHLQINDNNQYDILIHRFKNRRNPNHEPCYIPLLPIAQEILEKYHYKLPKYCNQVMNKVIKRVASQIGHPKPKSITMHVARKTAGCFYLNNDVPIESVAIILGHKDIRITQNHYAFMLNNTISRHTAHLRKNVD